MILQVANPAWKSLVSSQKRVLRAGGGWIIDLDMRKFFDTMDHSHIREILKKRVSDGVITRLIGKWLKAGVWEKGHISYPEQGSPQGGVISPLLSNIYLHEVLDRWFEHQVKPRLSGKAFLMVGSRQSARDNSQTLRWLHIETTFPSGSRPRNLAGRYCPFGK